MRKLLLTKPHLWDGKLSVSKSVCTSDFFIVYAATWGAMPIEPKTLPECLHPKDNVRSKDGEEQFSKTYPNGLSKPVLWIVDGCGLHEMEFCDPRRWQLPESVLPRFSDSLLRSGTVVWQTVGAGFLMKAARRFKGECADINADQVAAKESVFLNAKGVRYYNYTALALQYAPLMFDAIHFTYYWVPCAYTFPEMARLVAQLGFNQAVGRPVDVCPPGTADLPTTSSSIDRGDVDGIPLIGHPGGAYVSLAQEPDQAHASYLAALKLSGKALPAGIKGKGAAAAVAATVGGGASLGASTTDGSSRVQPSSSGEGMLTAAAGAAPRLSLQESVRQIATEFGGKKRAGALEMRIMDLLSKRPGHPRRGPHTDKP